jgi:hypothetical protein
VRRPRPRVSCGCLLGALVLAGCGQTGNRPSTTSPSTASSAPTATGAGATAPAPTASTTAAVNLDRVVLTAAQVGPGYTLRQRPDGHGAAGYVTLDLCGNVFPSEGLRTDRLQVNYTDRNGKVDLSNEVVTYRPGGAQQALRELRRAARTCPSGPTQGNIAGVGPLTTKVTEITAQRLRPGYVALVVTASGERYGKPLRFTETTIYQARGNVLSAVYGETAAGQRLAVHAAQESALKLATVQP